MSQAGMMGMHIAQARKTPAFTEWISVGSDTRYRARIGDYVVYGHTEGGNKAVADVLNRMSESKADLDDRVKSVVAAVADHVVKAVESGVADVGVVMGTYFNGGYIKVAVKIQQLDANRWWGMVCALFRGFDGHSIFSKHVVKRRIEYSGRVDRDAIYDAARVAYNAYSP